MNKFAPSGPETIAGELERWPCHASVNCVDIMFNFTLLHMEINLNLLVENTRESIKTPLLKMFIKF